MRSSFRVLLVLGLWGLLFLPGPGRAQSVTVEEVVGLLKAGVSEEVILFKVRQVPDGLDLSSEDMVKLREAGATDRFMLEVLKASGETALTPDQPVEISAAPKSATLMVFSTPAGARVLIDGVPSGTTPYVGNQLEPGQHEVYISKRFYRSISKLITAKVGDKLELKENLQLELPGVAVALKTKGLPKGNRWTVRGAEQCVGTDTGFLAVAREGKEEGRVVLRSQGGGRLYGSTCLEVYFWMQATGSAPGGEAPDPDAVFRIEAVDLDAVRLTELDLIILRDEQSPTGLRCQIAHGPGRLVQSAGTEG